MDHCPACCHEFLNNEKKTVCFLCGTCIVPERRSYEYTDDYPKFRSHFSPIVQKNKQKSFDLWLKKLNLSIKNKKVLEFGFGSGAVLSHIKEKQAEAYGVEEVNENIKHAKTLGIPEENLSKSLENFKNNRFDLIVYLDSFEHILNPSKHLITLNEVTDKGSQALIVLPRWDSLSRKIMGRLWPHDIADHWIFYSKTGLINLWKANGWRPVKSFFPGKYMSLNMIIAHFALMARIRKTPKLHESYDYSIPINFGELGILMERESTHCLEKNSTESTEINVGL